MPDRGLKRVCASCQTKFYDFNKSPVICPKCKAEFTGVVKIRTRRGRNVIEEAKGKAQVEEETPEVEEDDRTTVSLEEVEEDENKVADEGEDEEGGDLDLDDLDDAEEKDDDDEDLEDLDEDIEVEEKE